MVFMPGAFDGPPSVEPGSQVPFEDICLRAGNALSGSLSQGMPYGAAANPYAMAASLGINPAALSAAAGAAALQRPGGQDPNSQVPLTSCCTCASWLRAKQGASRCQAL